MDKDDELEPTACDPVLPKNIKQIFVENQNIVHTVNVNVIHIGSLSSGTRKNQYYIGKKEGFLAYRPHQNAVSFREIEGFIGKEDFPASQARKHDNAMLGNVIDFDEIVQRLSKTHLQYAKLK